MSKNIEKKEDNFKEVLEAIADTKKRAIRDSCELANITMFDSRKEQENALVEYIEKKLKNDFEESDYQGILDNICEFLKKSLGKIRIRKIVDETMKANIEEMKKADPRSNRLEELLGGGGPV